MADATVGADYNAGGIAFKISAGTTAFASGDSFTVTVADGVGSFVKSVKTATDGSQNPVAVLVDDVDATAGPRPGSAYFMGEFNARAIIFDPSWALDHLRASLPNGVYLKSRYRRLIQLRRRINLTFLPTRPERVLLGSNQFYGE